VSSSTRRKLEIVARALVLLTGVVFASAYCHGQDAAKNAVVIAVSPNGDDGGPGTPEKPYKTLKRAERAVRETNADHNVTVELGDGDYRISEPLLFAERDGGQNDHLVIWAAASNAHPVIDGGIQVTGWKLYDKDRRIYVADTPKGLDSRQLWVDGELAERAGIEIPRSEVTFTPEGFIFKDASFDYLAKVPDQNRMEIDATGFFTERVSPVERVDGRTLMMKQPAWNNNTWGWDTIQKPFGAAFARLYLMNSLEFLEKPGQWYLDPKQGKLYLRPPEDAEINKLDVELPRLTVLLAVGDSLDRPVHDLTFRGIRFSHTSWQGPSSDEGLANQQSGTFIVGRAPDYPADAFTKCAVGCPEFESLRNKWSQTPAAVEVAAAERITFDQDVFADLGQYAVGIGNDADANLTGVGLGASDVRVTRCVFTDLAGGAIEAGGVRPDAHHPSDVRMINRQIVISNNRIRSVSKDYRDNSAILSTYVTGALIVHNDISDVPYDAIDIGFGWGYEDAGGNANYRDNLHGYEFWERPAYQTPTTYHDTVVANNRIHDVKKLFHDGGAIYNLSASPGTMITENYVFDNHQRIALYLDEGSRYITVRRNVVNDPGGEWLNANTVHNALPLRITVDNTATGNWHNGTKVGGLWTNYENDLILDDHLVENGQWPVEAVQVMTDAGIEKSAGLVEFGNPKATAGEPDH